jgi:hypothetical protein
MRSAEKPTQRKRNRKGRVRSVFYRVANDIFKRGRCLVNPFCGAARDIFGLPIYILGGLVQNYRAVRFRSAWGGYQLAPLFDSSGRPFGGLSRCD